MKLDESVLSMCGLHFADAKILNKLAIRVPLRHFQRLYITQPRLDWIHTKECP